MQALRPSLIRQQAEPGARTESGMLRQGWFQNDLYSDDADPNLHNPRYAAEGFSTDSRALGFGFSTDSSATLVQAASVLYVAGFRSTSCLLHPPSCTCAAGHVVCGLYANTQRPMFSCHVALPQCLPLLSLCGFQTVLWPHSCGSCQSNTCLLSPTAPTRLTCQTACMTLFSC